jgi:hypothetical protein
MVQPNCVHYHAGQVRQIAQRIGDPVEAQVLRELDRRMAVATMDVDPSAAGARTTW